MYMNLKPNKHKRISFNTTTMASLGLIAPPPKILGTPLNLTPRPPPPKFNFLLKSPLSHQLFWSEIFRSTPKIRRGLLPC